MTDNAPRWQPDPTGRFEHRYWDGSQWTDNVANAGVASSDPYDTSVGGLDETAAVDSPADAGAGDPTVVGPPTDAADTGWAAPTAAQPATPADQTAAWPTIPPPPSFTPNAGPPPVTSSGGSKRGLLIGGGILAVVVLAIGAFLLLGGDDEDVRGDTIAALQDEDLTNDDATCLTDSLIEQLGTDEVAKIDFDSDEGPEGDVRDAVLEGVRDCEIDFESAGNDASDVFRRTGSEIGDPDTTDTDRDGGEPEAYGDDPDLDALYDDCEGGDLAACDTLYFDSPIDSAYEAFGETCGDRTDPSGGNCEATDGEGGSSPFATGELPEDFGGMFEGLGLTEEQTQCLMDAFSEMDPNIDPDEAMSTVFGMFEDCDIDPSEITGG